MLLNAGINLKNRSGSIGIKKLEIGIGTEIRKLIKRKKWFDIWTIGSFIGDTFINKWV